MRRGPGGERGAIRPWFALLLVTAVATHAVTYLCRPMASYQVLAIGGGGFEIGLVTASFAMLPLVLVLPLGRMADSGRVTLPLAGGAALQAATSLFLGNAGSLPELVVGNGLFGVGHLGTMIGLQSLIAALSDDARHDRDFGLFTAAASLGQLLGPAVGGLVLGHQEGAASLPQTQRAFLVAAVLAAVGAALCVVLSRQTRMMLTPSAGRARDRGGLSLLRSPGLLAGIATSMAVMSSVDIITGYLPLLGQDRGISPAVIGTLLSVRAGMSFASRLAIPFIMARVGRLSAIAGSSALSAACLVAVALSDNIVVLVVAVAVAGLLLGLGQPLSMTWVVRVVPESRRASALAHRLTGNRLGQVLAPMAAGSLTDSVGAAGPFWMAGGVLLVSVLFLLTGRRRPG